MHVQAQERITAHTLLGRGWETEDVADVCQIDSGATEGTGKSRRNRSCSAGPRQLSGGETTPRPSTKVECAEGF